jgi:hypothetical protein
VRLSAAVRVHRTASHERSSPSEDAKAAHGRPGRLSKGARKPLTPHTVRVDTSTITASRMPIMYRMEAPNALRYLRRPTTLR